MIKINRKLIGYTLICLIISLFAGITLLFWKVSEMNRDRYREYQEMEKFHRNREDESKYKDEEFRKKIIRATEAVNELNRKMDEENKIKLDKIKE